MRRPSRNSAASLPRIEPQIEADDVRRLGRRRNFRPPGPQAAGPGDALSSLWPEQAGREVSCPHRRGGVSARTLIDAGQSVCGREAVERGRQVVRSGLDQGSPQRVGLVSAGLGTNQARRGGRGPQADGTGPDGSPGRRRKPPRPGADARPPAPGRRSGPAAAVAAAPGGAARSVDRAALMETGDAAAEKADAADMATRLAAGRRGMLLSGNVFLSETRYLLAVARAGPQRSGARVAPRGQDGRGDRGTASRPRRSSPPTFNWPWIAMPSCGSTARRARPTPFIGGCWSSTRPSAAIFPAAAPTTTISPGWRPISIAISTRPWPMPSGPSSSEPQSAGILDTLGRSPFPPRQSGRGRAAGQALPGDGTRRRALQEAACPVRREEACEEEYRGGTIGRTSVCVNPPTQEVRIMDESMGPRKPLIRSRSSSLPGSRFATSAAKISATEPGSPWPGRMRGIVPCMCRFGTPGLLAGDPAVTRRSKALGRGRNRAPVEPRPEML